MTLSALLSNTAADSAPTTTADQLAQPNSKSLSSSSSGGSFGKDVGLTFTRVTPPSSPHFAPSALSNNLLRDRAATLPARLSRRSRLSPAAPVESVDAANTASEAERSAGVVDDSGSGVASGPSLSVSVPRKSATLANSSRTTPPPAVAVTAPKTPADYGFTGLDVYGDAATTTTTTTASASDYMTSFSLPLNYSAPTKPLQPGEASRLCHIDEVLPGFLYIGGEKASQDLNTLQRLGIGAIVNCSLQLHNLFPDNCSYLRVPVLDHEDEPINEHFLAAARFIEQAHCAGVAVLVHCRAGMSRSAAVAAAYLILFHGMSAEAALDTIAAARPLIEPNRGFIRQLVRWEQLVATDPELQRLEASFSKSCDGSDDDDDEGPFSFFTESENGVQKGVRGTTTTTTAATATQSDSSGKSGSGSGSKKSVESGVSELAEEGEEESPLVIGRTLKGLSSLSDGYNYSPSGSGRSSATGSESGGSVGVDRANITAKRESLGLSTGSLAFHNSRTENNSNNNNTTTTSGNNNNDSDDDEDQRDGIQQLHLVSGSGRSVSGSSLGLNTDSYDVSRTSSATSSLSSLFARGDDSPSAGFAALEGLC